MTVTMTLMMTTALTTMMIKLTIRRITTRNMPVMMKLHVSSNCW